MKKFTLLTVFFLVALVSFNTVSAQKPTSFDSNNNPTQKARCATMEALQVWLDQNPDMQARFNQTKEQQMAQAQNIPVGIENRRAIVTIPVVFHLVLPAADQARVTDADVIWQLNKMNEDFSGLNADSTNAVPFYSIRGRSEIRFCFARQDENGNPTNGINRVVSTITSFSCNGSAPVLKSDATCGATAWNVNKYFNIWVGRGGGCLGVATFPGTGPANEQGIVLDLTGFSNNPAYVAPAFNLGRTAVHEAGHYFGLYHSWGDEAGCTGDDFRQLPGSCLLPAAQLLGDTPNQGNATSGCPAGTVTDACSPTAPGFNYQNYMDYTDDRCYSMFTKKQVERAEWVLNNCRATLGTSNGCTPVTQVANDASVTVIFNPGTGGCGVAGGTTFCPGNSIVPIVNVRNYGTNSIANMQFITQIDGVTVGAPFTYSTALGTFSSANVTLPAVAAPAAPGPHTIKIYSNLPNGTADGKPVNDTATRIFTVGGGIAPPISEGFESTTFPPAGWSISNPDGGITWARSTLAARTGVASARLNFYNYGTRRQIDQLRAPALTTAGIDSLIVDFSVAYALYSNTDIDTLAVQVSTDCGNTFTTVYKKWGAALATAPLTTASFTPTAAQWRNESVDLTSFIPSGSAIIAFTGINQFGNNVYIDNINIRRVILLVRDAAVAGVNDPFSKICTPNSPVNVVLKNLGKDTLRSVKINYTIDGGAPVVFNWTGLLPKGQQTNVALTGITGIAPGPHVLRSYTSEPNGLADQDPTNDTTRITFNVLKNVSLPVKESFESTTFPPADWGRANQDNLGTWFRTTVAARDGAASAAMDNYNYDARGTFDDVEAPVVAFAGVDSTILSFQLANASYEYPGNTSLRLDTLEVLVTKDCGKTFTTVYKKWGEDLQTIRNPNDPNINLFLPRQASDWRRETINITSATGTSGTFQVIFRNRGNFGNTTLIDDININGKTLPAKLKEQGYLILPNPFSERFSIQHYLPPTDLQVVQLYNSNGQLVYQKKYSGAASSNIEVDMTSKPAGIYTVRMAYAGKLVTEKIVKLK